eukprot:COSAG01_NODE_778_length_13681_cov_15.265130_19_plen_90_part_00
MRVHCPINRLTVQLGMRSTAETLLRQLLLVAVSTAETTAWGFDDFLARCCLCLFPDVVWRCGPAIHLAPRAADPVGDPARPRGCRARAF